MSLTTCLSNDVKVAPRNRPSRMERLWEDFLQHIQHQLTSPGPRYKLPQCGPVSLYSGRGAGYAQWEGRLCAVYDGRDGGRDAVWEGVCGAGDVFVSLSLLLC